MKKIIRIVLIAAAILLIPLVAMLFDNGVNWSAFDFLVAGALLIGAGLVYEFGIARLKGNRRLLVGGAFLTAFLLLWAHLAVGIVDSWPLAGS